MRWWRRTHANAVEGDGPPSATATMPPTPSPLVTRGDMPPRLSGHVHFLSPELSPSFVAPQVTARPNQVYRQVASQTFSSYFVPFLRNVFDENDKASPGLVNEVDQSLGRNGIRETWESLCNLLRDQFLQHAGEISYEAIIQQFCYSHPERYIDAKIQEMLLGDMQSIIGDAVLMNIPIVNSFIAFFQNDAEFRATLGYVKSMLEMAIQFK